MNSQEAALLRAVWAACPSLRDGVGVTSIADVANSIGIRGADAVELAERIEREGYWTINRRYAHEGENGPLVQLTPTGIKYMKQSHLP